jgi:hypothetical protein
MRSAPDLKAGTALSTLHGAVHVKASRTPAALICGLIHAIRHGFGFVQASEIRRIRRNEGHIAGDGICMPVSLQ